MVKPAAFDEARGTLTGYLYLVTRGVALDRLRAATAQQARDTKYTARTITTVDEPSVQLIANERHDHLRAALEALHPAERDVIEAAYYRHTTYREVAEQLGIPVGTVKSRIRLALVRLRGVLSAPILRRAPRDEAHAAKTSWVTSQTGLGNAPDACE